MTKDITRVENKAYSIIKTFDNIVIETKDDVNEYMHIAEALSDTAQFAKAWILKLAKENVFKGINNEVIKYADEKFGIKRASALQYLKIAKEYLIDATKSKLCAYYCDEKFVAFLDDKENAPKEEDKSGLYILDFTYTQIAVMMSKGYEEVRNLIASGTVTPHNTVAEIKKKLKTTVEATFTDNASDNAEISEEPTQAEKTEIKSKTTMYVDNNGTKHTFEEITATDSDKTVFFKTVGEFAVTVEISLLDIDNEEATAKITKYTIEK